MTFEPGSYWLTHRDRRALRYVVMRCVCTDMFGAGYRYARNDKAQVLRFWLRRNAEAYAKKLNEGIE